MKKGLSEQVNKRAFENLKVADFSWAVAGPFVSKYLADHGATVVRIESAERPCITRLVGPYAEEKPGINRAGFFAFMNANKYSCAINLKNARGLELAKRLILWADVVIESFRPGTMENMGLEYKTIEKIRPDIIYLHSSTLGNTGPYRRYGGFGFLLVALCGFSHLTGYENEQPLPFLHAYTDYICPRFLASALVASLIHRHKTGRGRFIDGSQMESSLWFLAPTILDYTTNKRLGERKGNKDSSSVPHGVYRCRGEDRWIAITVSDSKEWEGLCKAMEYPKWTQDAEFVTSTGRQKNEDFINNKINEWTTQYSPEELTNKLQALGVPAGTVHNGRELAENMELRAEGALWEMMHDQIGPFTHLGQPFRMSKTPAEARMAGPTLGAHTEYICKNILDVSDGELAELYQSGALH